MELKEEGEREEDEGRNGMRKRGRTKRIGACWGRTRRETKTEKGWRGNGKQGAGGGEKEQEEQKLEWRRGMGEKQEREEESRKGRDEEEEEGGGLLSGSFLLVSSLPLKCRWEMRD